MIYCIGPYHSFSFRNLRTQSKKKKEFSCDSMDLPRKNMKNQQLKQGKRCLSKLMCKGEIVIQVHFRRRIHNVKEILRRLNNNGYFWQNF